MCDELNNVLCEPGKPWTACMKDEKCKNATPYQRLFDPEYKGCLEDTQCAACCPYGSRNLPIEQACTGGKQWRDCKWDREDGKCIRKVGGHFLTKDDCDTHSGACYDALKEKCGRFINNCSHTDGSATTKSSYEQLQECLYGDNYVNRYESFLKGNLSTQPELQIPECKYSTNVVNRFIKTACGKEFVGKCDCRYPGEVYPAYQGGPAVWINNVDYCYVPNTKTQSGWCDGHIDSRGICRGEESGFVSYHNLPKTSCTNKQNSYFCDLAKDRGRSGFEKQCDWKGPKNPFPTLPLGYDCMNMGHGLECVGVTNYTRQGRPEFTSTRKVGGLIFNDPGGAKKMCEESCKPDKDSEWRTQLN